MSPVRSGGGCASRRRQTVTALDPRGHLADLAASLPTVFLCLLVGFLPASLPGQQPSARPLTKSELIRLLVTDTYTETEIAGIVSRSCLSFRPGPLDLADLRSLGAGETVVEAVRACASRTTPVADRDVGVPAAPPIVSDVVAPLRDPAGLPGKPDGGGSLPAGTLPRPAAPPLPALEADGSFLEELERPPRPADEEAFRERIASASGRLGVAGAGASGRPLRCELWVYVDLFGSVLDARVERSSGVEVFDAIALETVRSTRYRPALVRGRPAGSWLRQVVSFRP